MKNLNVKLLRKIQEHITEEPRRYDQYAIVEESIIAPCGTVACIAGWANILTGVSPNSDEAADLDRAAKKLGLNRYEQIDWWGFHYVFDLMGWPDKYKDQHDKAKTPKARAKAACARIDHLIETGE